MLGENTTKKFSPIFAFEILPNTLEMLWKQFKVFKKFYEIMKGGMNKAFGTSFSVAEMIWKFGN